MNNADYTEIVVKLHLFVSFQILFQTHVHHVCRFGETTEEVFGKIRFSYFGIKCTLKILVQFAEMVQLLLAFLMKLHKFHLAQLQLTFKLSSYFMEIGRTKEVNPITLILSCIHLHSQLIYKLSQQDNIVLQNIVFEHHGIGVPYCNTNYLHLLRCILQK